jgi:hypothetical protein
MKKPKYYPNKWELLNKAPSRYFKSITFEEFMDWKIKGYVIPHDVSCIIRERNNYSGKVKEYVYKTDLAAKKRVGKMLDEGMSEVTICDNTTIQVLHTEDFIDDLQDDF